LIEYGIASDPRIKVISMGAPTIELVEDETGRVFQPHAFQKSSPAPIQANAQNCWDIRALFGESTKIKGPISIRGKVDFTVLSESDDLAIDNLEDHVNRNCSLSGYTVCPQFLSVHEKSLECRIIASNDNKIDHMPLYLTLKDANDNEIWHFATKGGGLQVNAIGAFVKPFRLMLQVPTRTKKFAFRFKIDNIPVP
jgi:hypothetical protein